MTCDATDADLDALYAAPYRAAADRYWTPVEVATVAATWLAEGGAARILDVGSGVGKFCIVGARTTGASFVGLEHRRPLVEAAREAAERAGVAEKTLFVNAEASLPLMRGYMAMYLFNPFGENLYAKDKALDQTVELGHRRYNRDVGLVEEVLRLLPFGGRVATYHGFGGRLPDTMVLERQRPIGSDILRLWVKKREQHTGYWIETDLGVRHVPLSAPRVRT